MSRYGCMKEFEEELALLRGRVDGLEAKVGELEALQFSTTTASGADDVGVVRCHIIAGAQC